MTEANRPAIEHVWRAISFPEATLLSKRIPKKQFLESAGLATSDKKLIQENVKNVYWEYTLKPSTCQVLPFRDDKHEYLEVAVLQIALNTQKGYKRIAEIIHRIIPYPLMLGFYTDSREISLSIAPKRFSQAEHGVFVAERFHTTAWMNPEKLNVQESAFMDSLAWGKTPIQTYGALYEAWIDCFTGYACALWSGSFTLGKADDRLVYLTQCREIESRILALRQQLKKSAFNQQVELNTQIKTYEQKLKQLAASL